MEPVVQKSIFHYCVFLAVTALICTPYTGANALLVVAVVAIALYVFGQQFPDSTGRRPPRKR
jgi:hypothetical protein